MPEIFAVARVGYNLSRRTVYLRAADPGRSLGYAGKLRAKHDIVNVFHLVGRIADGDGARHIRAVAVLEAAEVHRHKITLAHYGVRRYAVRHAGVCARHGDWIEAVALAAVL